MELPLCNLAGDGDFMAVCQLAIIQRLLLGTDPFLQGKIRDVFTGLVDDGEAHFGGFFLGCFFPDTGRENNQCQHEDQNQSDNLFHVSYFLSQTISVSSFSTAAVLRLAQGYTRYLKVLAVKRVFFTRRS
jgi:hypothetical protein